MKRCNEPCYYRDNVRNFLNVYSVKKYKTIPQKSVPKSVLFCLVLVAKEGYSYCMKYKLKRKQGRKIQIQWEGSDKWLSTGCDTLTEAREWAERQSGQVKRVKFGEYADGFFERTDADSIMMRNKMNGSDIRESSYHFFQKILNLYLMPFFKNMAIEDITPRVIDEWKMSLKIKTKNNTTKSNSTINSALSVLSVILNSAVYDEIIKANPVKVVKYLKLETKEKPIWTDDEIQKLFPSDKESLIKIWRDYNFAVCCMVLYETGFRPSEALALQKSCFYPELNGIHTSGTIDVFTHSYIGKIKTSNKGKKYKVSIISDKLTAILKEYIEKLPQEQEFLFLRKNGDFITSVGLNHAVRQACEQAKVTVHGPYTFRHNFMTRISANLDDATVMELMGHTTWEACYDHRTPETIIRKAKAMIDKNKT